MKAILIILMIVPLVGSAIITGNNTLAETDPFESTGFNWDYVYNYKNSSAVAVDPYWILTASHVADDSPNGDLTIGTTTYYQQEIIYHNTADLALVRYDKALPGFYDLYAGSLYVGDDILMVGYGNTGSVTSNSFTDGGSGSGTLRWGSNEIETLSLVNSTIVLGAGFDQSATINEAGVGVYDSGGGSFVYDGSGWKLVGINIVRGPSSPYTDSYMASVPTYESWISGTIPEPSTVVLLGCFGGMFLVVRRYLYKCL
jgi:hypothetical protein